MLSRKSVSSRSPRGHRSAASANRIVPVVRPCAAAATARPVGGQRPATYPSPAVAAGRQRPCDLRRLACGLWHRDGGGDRPWALTGGAVGGVEGDSGCMRCSGWCKQGEPARRVDALWRRRRCRRMCPMTIWLAVQLQHLQPARSGRRCRLTVVPPCCSACSSPIHAQRIDRNRPNDIRCHRPPRRRDDACTSYIVWRRHGLVKAVRRCAVATLAVGSGGRNEQDARKWSLIGWKDSVGKGRERALPQRGRTGNSAAEMLNCQSKVTVAPQSQ